MYIAIDKNLATDELFGSYQRALEHPSGSSPISEAVETVLNGRGCITYKYIMLTAILSKATDPSIDALSLQKDDLSDGAYAPRTVCKDVVYPFQKKYLDNVIDGANSDPFVGNPGRHLRLSPETPSRGDPRRALLALCEALPTLKTQDEAREALDFVMTRLISLRDERRKAAEDAETLLKAAKPSIFVLRGFLSDLLDQNFGGDALLLVTSALYRLRYPENGGFSVVPHPVNQSGRSGRQSSDLDVALDSQIWLATELKDKPFTEGDVRNAADTALRAGASRLMFVAGRSSGESLRSMHYFDSVRRSYAENGMYVGLCDIDSLMDVTLSSCGDMEPSDVMMGVYRQVMDNAGTPETQMWVYGRIQSLK